MSVSMLGLFFSDSFFFLFVGQDDWPSFHNKGVDCDNSNFPQGSQLTTPGVWNESGQLNTNFFDDCKELQSSYEWPDFDDFPSSEDLSAFLADLEKDDISKEAGQCLPTQRSKPRNSPRLSVTSDGMTSHMMTSNNATCVKTLGEMTSDLMTSNIATLKEVVYRLSQTPIKEGCTELTDFPSSEDLDAFLADMELDCENIPLGNSSDAVSTMKSEAFHNKGNYKAVRTFTTSELMVHNMGDTDHSKHSKSVSKLSDKEEAICDMNLTSDSFCQCASLSDKSVHNIDSSDSQFVRDCERVFTKLSEHTCNDIARIDNATRNHSSVFLHNNFGVNNQERSRQKKHLCASGCSVEELHEEDNVCKMPLKHGQVNVVRSHDRDTNETEDQQGSRPTGKECTLVDHHGNSDKSKCGFEMSNDEFYMMSSSPVLFSQSLSRVEQNCSKTPDLFSSPGVFNGETCSRCSKHLSRTPNLFSSPISPPNHTHSVSRQEVNSVSLFSSSDHSRLSSSSRFSSRAQPTSFPVSSKNEAHTLPITNNYEIGNQFDKDFQTACFHSTPCSTGLSSKISRKMWTPARVSPLLNDSRGTRPCNDYPSIQGTPILFSPMSNSSL